MAPISQQLAARSKYIILDGYTKGGQIEVKSKLTFPSFLDAVSEGVDLIALEIEEFSR